SGPRRNTRAATSRASSGFPEGRLCSARTTSWRSRTATWSSRATAACGRRWPRPGIGRWASPTCTSWTAAPRRGPRAGSRSSAASLRAVLAGAALKALGDQRVSVLGDGMAAWIRAGLPVEQGLSGVMNPPNDVLTMGTDRTWAEAIQYLRWEEELGKKYETH